MRRAGCQEVTVNAGKRSRSNPENESSHSNIKRPKRAEVNFLPNFPQGKDPSILEQLRQTIVEEVTKTEKSLPLIRKMMETTFPLRRQTIVMSCPPVNELMNLWPALKIENEVIWISFLKWKLLWFLLIWPLFSALWMCARVFKCYSFCISVAVFSSYCYFNVVVCRVPADYESEPLQHILCWAWPPSSSTDDLIQTEGIKNWEDSRCSSWNFKNPRWTGK